MIQYVYIFIYLQAVEVYKEALNEAIFIPELYDVNFGISECYYFLV